MTNSARPYSVIASFTGWTKCGVLAEAVSSAAFLSAALLAVVEYRHALQRLIEHAPKGLQTDVLGRFGSALALGGSLFCRLAVGHLGRFGLLTQLFSIDDFPSHGDVPVQSFSRYRLCVLPHLRQPGVAPGDAAGRASLAGDLLRGRRNRSGCGARTCARQRPSLGFPQEETGSPMPPLTRGNPVPTGPMITDLTSID